MQWALKREDFFSIYSLLVNFSYLRIVFRYIASTDIKVPPHTLKWELAFESGYWLSGYTLCIFHINEKEYIYIQNDSIRVKSGEKLCPSIEKFVNCGCDIDQEASSSNHIDPHFHILWFNTKKNLISHRKKLSSTFSFKLINSVHWFYLHLEQIF